MASRKDGDVSRTVLILGGGIGGIVAANVLRRRLPPKNRVVMVDREPCYSFAGSHLWILSGTRTPEQVSYALDRLQRKGIEVIQGEVEHIDPAQHQAVVAGTRLTADYLVLALGAEFVLDSIEGLRDGGLNFATSDGAFRLRDALSEFAEGRVVIITASPLYKCPAAPYEAAMLIEEHFRRRGLGPRVQIDLYTAEPGPMGVAGPTVSSAVRGMVESKGIGYHPDRHVARVDSEKRIAEFSDGEKVQYDVLAYMPTIQAPRVVRESPLVDESGWVTVDRPTLETRFPGVYAVGDMTLIPLRMGKPLPKAGVFAHGQAEVVAQNLSHSIAGRGREVSYTGHGGCFVEVGDGKAGYGAGDFYAEPLPVVKMRRPRRFWHSGKVLFEKYWFRRWS